MGKNRNAQPVEEAEVAKAVEVAKTESLEQAQEVAVISETVQESAEEVSSPEMPTEPVKAASGLLARLAALLPRGLG